MEIKEKDIIIIDNRKLNDIKNKISNGGALKFYVISDFDRTLTKLFVSGERIHSMLSILRKGSYLAPEYNKEAHNLFDKYHPIEIGQKISPEEKRKAMEEWWKEHFKILVKFGLNKKHIERIINSGNIKLREGTPDFLDFLYSHQIPILFISSSGLGDEAISMVLKKEGKLYSNIYIISNTLQWDEKGNFIGVEKPIIHSSNKDGSMIRESAVFKEIHSRKNILLLGDNVEDCQMVNGLNYENLLKIGFLNEEIDKNLSAYKNNFDILILNDGSMEYVNNILKEIIF